jgi:hypothetical protein
MRLKSPGPVEIPEDMARLGFPSYGFLELFKKEIAVLKFEAPYFRRF